MGLLALLNALVPVGLGLDVGVVLGTVPPLLTKVPLLLDSGPLVDVWVESGIRGEGITDVSVSVRDGLKKVTVTVDVSPSDGVEKVLPVFEPVNVPVRYDIY